MIFIAKGNPRNWKVDCDSNRVTPMLKGGIVYSRTESGCHAILVMVIPFFLVFRSPERNRLVTQHTDLLW